MTFMRIILKWLFTLCFRLRIEGLRKLDFSRPHILIPNHVSLLDAVLLALYLPKNVTFVVNTEIAQRFSFVIRLCKHITVDPFNPYSVRQMIRVINKGESLVIFPEGRITTTGGLMKIYSGVAYLAMRTGVVLYPVILQGLERSKLSYLRGKIRTVWFPQVTITVGDPFPLPKQPGISMKVQKAAASDFILRTLQKEWFASRAKNEVNLFNEVLHAAAIHGSRVAIAKDPTGSLTYRRLLLGSYLLADLLNRKCPDQQTVGLFLPSSNGHLVALLALFRLNVTPAILNFSLGVQTLLDCCKTAGIKTILTSRTFIAKGKLEPMLAAFIEQKIQIIYLEDVKASAGFGDAVRAYFRYLRKQRASVSDKELVLFTSGSESKPKGVVLSHANLFCNVQQARSVIDLTAKDKILNALPLFHSFGLTAGTFLPVILGVPVYFYPSPLHYKVIAELCYDRNATIIFGTSTFLAGYGKAAHPFSFYSMRYVFAGAEKLRPEVRQLWMEKFGIRILEGYGTTETAPILSLNTPLQNKAGSVGRLLPGIDYRLKPVEGIAEGGELLVKGPNVMKGYLLHNQDFQPVGEWYATGDLVEVDQDGFITIKSRLKRFAKIGGEMVSLNLVEELASQCFDHPGFAAVSIAHARKGEQILLFTNDATVSLGAIRDRFREKQVSPLLIPSALHFMPEFPLLGTGKTDYVTLQQIAERREG
ncbi:AMP-binding protein [Brevibacillus fulvus]|uniref:Acyl-[acyl-carrier-protein]-phospholipid O-acyltransferase/long-chain-fatty-acid--[acyl-carrier-protein] ligase n=1 Tax=Brevibacillus fulvus TaxID=1125967 RepID=A0A939BUB0_9BACL|nr:AMP-binding protein [Brevibacillus fulvus]MBM7590299.1 acyl-[acyl-carrier-protein]-phospholipid O-acyltransferase/long-chain-fatty-acid--[acyl-carrier-protein] ligase [Brevibacillus fulvus]